MRDFNATEIVTEVPVGATRLEEGIEIFDDDINEAQEEFEVFLTVEGNFTVLYLIRTAVCRISESDRKLSCMHSIHNFVRCFVIQLTTIVLHLAVMTEMQLVSTF